MNYWTDPDDVGGLYLNPLKAALVLAVVVLGWSAGIGLADWLITYFN